MYYLYGKINRGHRICPLYGGCPLFGGSAIRGFTVFPVFLTVMLFWLTKTKTNIDFSYTTYILVIKTKTNLTMYENNHN